MLEAQEVIVMQEGIRVSSDSVARIGIAHDSVCWGLWVPDRRHWPPSEDSHRSAATQEHLMISPFEPSSWPVLFRIEIYIKDDDSGTLAAAIEPLSKLANIVWLEAAPAGHHHAVVSIIAEDTITKHDGSLSNLKRLGEPSRTFRDERTWREVHDSFSKNLLKRSCEITDSIVRADRLLGENGFLREIFLPPEDDRFERGVLYSVGDLPENIAIVGKQQATPAVKCTWLQNLAFFWLYGRSPANKAIEFRYDTSSQALTPRNRDRSIFREGLERFSLPAKTLGSFHHLERFLRLVMSDDDLDNRTARVNIPYEARFSPSLSTRGFQHRLYDAMKRQNLNIRHVSMVNQHRSLDAECGKLSVLVSSQTGSFVGDLDALKRCAGVAVDEAIASLTDIGISMTCDPITVERLAAKKLFFSTKFDWLTGYPHLVGQLGHRANAEGFSLLTARNENRAEMDRLVPEGVAEQSITVWTTILVKNADAFLQLIPRSVLDNQSNGLNWLQYEFGAAQALGIPCAMLVDCSGGTTLDDWKRILKVGADFRMFEFFSDKDTSYLLDALSEALRELAQ